MLPRTIKPVGLSSACPCLSSYYLELYWPFVMVSIEKYKIPRTQVDVEELAVEFSNYFRITAEDLEALRQDPACGFLPVLL